MGEGVPAGLPCLVKTSVFSFLVFAYCVQIPSFMYYLWANFFKTLSYALCGYIKLSNRSPQNKGGKDRPPF